MAAYNQLPVYKAGYDLLLELFQLTHNFNREYKYTLGEKLKNEVTDLLTNIYKANKTFTKHELIDKARVNLEIVRLYIRILKDLKQISQNRHVNINERIENISKQLAGWYKSANKNKPNT